MHHRSRLFVLVPLCVVFFFGAVMAQDKAPKAAAPVSSCSRDNALNIIDRQIDLSKTIDNDPKRIALLLRAADLMWAAEQERARATFSDAFDIATRIFKEKGDADTRQGRLIVGGIDYRYTVITAIAKRDSAWARKLTKQILNEQDEAKDKAQQDAAQDSQTAAKLLGSASSLITSDQQAALEFARTSLRYPATLYLPMFVLKLWEANRALADQFYAEALNAYGQAPMDQFLYLSSYPFAANREIGEMPAWTIYAVPAGMRPNPTLQRAFVQTLLSRARAFIQDPGSSQPGRYSDNAQVFLALSRLEPLVATSLPDLSPALAEAKGNIAALLTEPEQQRTANTLTVPPKRSFDETIEGADKLANADQREATIALAVLNAAETESLEKLEAAGLKLDDVELRKQIMSLVYFYRSQKMIKDKKLDEAHRLAAKVDETDQRAYLYAQIAADSLKQRKNDAEAREILDEVIDAVAKAPDSEMKARAMLVVIHLYSTIDPNRAVALLGDVVKIINHVESVDLSSDRINKHIEGKAFGTYRTLQTLGFSPEAVFQEIGKLDFDGTLYLASNLNDKTVRGMTTLAIAEQCLKDLPPPPKPKPDKTTPPKPERSQYRER